MPELDAVIAPVGGGGLLSGTAIADAAPAPAMRVHGAGAGQCRRCGAKLPFRPGRAAASATTIADGLRTTLSPRTLGAIRAGVEGIGVASEAAIARAMRMLWERAKLVVEPSAAVTLACLLERTLDLREARVGVILSGGNVDLDRLPWQS